MIRTRKMSTKRALGLAMAAALAVGATIAVAGSSEAAAAKYTLGSTTTSTGQKVSVKGTDFTDDGGASLIDLAKISFETAACPALKSGVGTALGTAATAVTDTRITLTAPTLALTNSKPTKYNVCFYGSASAAPLAGSAAVIAYAVPNTFTVVSGSAGPSYGGTKMVITGQDFTAKSNITVGGAEATGTKVVLGKTASDLDTITAYSPANNGLAATIRVSGEAGPVATGSTFTYTNAIEISPSGSDGTAGRVITVDGTGFSTLSFQDTLADAKSTVVLVKAGTALTTTSTFYTSSAYVASGASSYYVCNTATVTSDTELTCLIPDLTGTKAGAYTVAIVTFDSAHALVAAKSTGYSRSATYTSATF